MLYTPYTPYAVDNCTTATVGYPTVTMKIFNYDGTASSTTSYIKKLYIQKGSTCADWGYDNTESTTCNFTVKRKWASIANIGCDATIAYYPDDLAELEWQCFESGRYPEEIRQKTPEEKLREIIQSRQAPMVLTNKDRQAVKPTTDFKEICARETLRRVLGDQEYRTFVRNGFVSVRPKSGLVYQIFPAHGITNVYRDGEKIERLCVVLRGDFPPTDSLIMRYLLILNDEQGFRKLAIKHQVIVNKPLKLNTENGGLPEIYRRLKLAG